MWRVLFAPFVWIWNGLKALAGLAFPMFAGARTPRGPGPVARRVLHVVLLVVILLILAVINVALGLDRYLRVPLAPLSGLREVWLPILFLLFYSLCWLGWFLWRLLGPDQELSAFPDIDSAWEEAMRALDQADIDVAATPLFLVIGRAAAGEKALFQASEMSFQVRQAPRRIDSPLYVYAHRDAVYLSCAGASVMGRQAAILAGEAGADLEGILSTAERDAIPEDFETILSANDLSRPGAEEELAAAAAAQMAARSSLVERAREGLGVSGLESPTEEHMSTLLPAPGATMLLDDAGTRERGVERQQRPRQSLVKNTDEIEQLSERLRHLCLLIARERRPDRPINGILLLVLLAATDDDADAKETASLCQRDLTTVREALRVQCPVFTVLCDLERTLGYEEFHRHFPDEQRKRLLGQSFPLVPDLEPTAKLRKIEEGVQWIGNVLLPSLVYRLWRLESTPRDEAGSATAANVRLFRFLAEVRDRQRRFSRIVTRGIVLPSQGPLMLGGCYLAGTGRDSSREQGFIAGVFRYLVENQNFVAWTSEALEEEVEYRRWTSFGYVVFGLIIAILVVMIVSVVWPFR